MFKPLIVVCAVLRLLSACGDSDSGAMITPSLPGTNVPASFVGTYTGSLTVTASTLDLTEAAHS